jgi:hypothetical protein
MEKRSEKKINLYMSNYKENIKNKAIELGLINNPQCNGLIQYIYDEENLKLTKEDFMKRKRCKNNINMYDRCCAKRANGDICSRRKKEGSDYCGTHIKGTPHGIIEKDEHNKINTKEKVEVFAQDINGIIYYIDDKNNVYDIEDILKNIENPKIIAKYLKVENKYTIPDFNLNIS